MANSIAEISDPISIELTINSTTTTTLRLWQPEVPRGLVVLAHGAGIGMDSTFVQYYFRRFAQAGLATAIFNFPYMEHGRKVPDRSPILDETLRNALEELRGQMVLKEAHLFLGGKSMGARVCVRVAQERDDVRGLFCLGYPLHSASKTESLRTDYLDRLKMPVQFVQGSKDPMCRQDRFDESIRRILPKASVAWIAEADHSLILPKSLDPSGEKGWEGAFDAVLPWMDEIIATPLPKPKRRRRPKAS